jgi:DNA-binding NarL/FixJ family response regulator
LLNVGAVIHEVIAVIDPVGQVYEALMRAEIGVPLRRVTHLNGSASAVSLVVLASYGQVDWDLLTRLAARAPTLVLASPQEREDALHAMCLRACGYVDAAAEPPVLRRAVLAAHGGELAYARGVLADFVRMQLHSPQARRASRLTPRQREVVALVARGAADKEIAHVLGISTATAQKHVTNVLRKLGVPNRAAAAAAASALALT